MKINFSKQFALRAPSRRNGWFIAPLTFLCFSAVVVQGVVPPGEYPHPWDPDPERFSDSIKKFAEKDQVLMPPKGALVATGSSSMAMWHKTIRGDLAGLTVIPRGFGGSHFSDVIYFIDEVILKYQPRAVLIYEGDNDITGGKTPERIRDDLRFLVEHCRKTLPDLRFYVLSIKPSIAREALWPKMQTANAMLKAYCEATEGCHFIDVASALLNEDGGMREDIFLKDMLHLNNLGYQLWTKAIAPVLLETEKVWEK
jgi:lysophospholipase L1-like esterase